MKTQKNISKLVAGAAIAFASVMPSYGQNNLGAACGCPPVSARTTVTVSSLPGFSVIANSQGGGLTLGGNWTCDKTYVLDQKIYIPSGQVLVIQPGTVIKGNAVTTPSLATSLIVTRGGKLIAAGTEECPIVFTAAADPMNNTYGISNKGIWGGVVILGKATNNLKLTPNGPYVAGGAGLLAVADGLGVVEGFATSIPEDRYGVNTSATAIAGELSNQTFDDNDNSGILRYVSIRHAGAILAVGAEINGLTCGSVGRGTTLEHIEIVSCADDNIEFFGGTVNIKYVTTVFGNDDMFDWDCGWTGNAQFLFGMKGDLTFSQDNDNGFEADADDQRSNFLPRSHPIIYNATFMGNSKSTLNSDNSSIAAINAKDLTEGEIYNSIFANFKNGFNTIKSLGSNRSFTAGGESWHNWSNTAGPASSTNGNGSQSLKVKCNTFVGVTNPLTIASATTAVTAADNTQFTTTDLNTIITGNTLPGFDYNFTVNPTTNVFATKNDVVPNPALAVTGCPVAPVNGFFSPANYRGAFSTTGENWLSDWTYSSVIGSTKGSAGCPTDINKDGNTDVNDFLIFAGSFGLSCN
jgi:hypothetical protein